MQSKERMKGLLAAIIGLALAFIGYIFFSAFCRVFDYFPEYMIFLVLVILYLQNRQYDAE